LSQLRCFRHASFTSGCWRGRLSFSNDPNSRRAQNRSTPRCPVAPHVYTTDQDLKRSIHYPDWMAAENLPRGFVRLVYCLGYGENRLLDSPIRDVRNGGTPQYWKVFHACLNSVRRNEDFALLQTSRTPALERRIRAKRALLAELRESGVWLVDASIAALASPGRARVEPRRALQVLRESWDSYTGDVLREAKPQAIICIGQGVAAALRTELDALGVSWEVVAQPQARLPRTEHFRFYERYRAICVAG